MSATMPTAQVRGAPESAIEETALATLALCLENCKDLPEWIGRQCVKECRNSQELFLTLENILADFGASASLSLVQDSEISLVLSRVGQALLAGGTLYIGYRLLKHVRRSLITLPEWMSFVYVVAMHFRLRKHLRTRSESARPDDDLEPALHSSSSLPRSGEATPMPAASLQAKKKRSKPVVPKPPTVAVPTVSKFAAKRPRPKGKLPYPGPYPLYPEPAYEGISGETAVFRMLWAFWHILVTHARKSVEDAEGHLILDFKASELYAFAVEHEYGTALGSPERTQQILLDLIQSKRFPDNVWLMISPAPDSLFQTGPNERALRCALDSMLDINGLWDPFEENDT
ncbi:hypothetical protein BMF94_4235 [Rhodotorula taiwanensis]|uniref:Uncharacterized protein n=1 Tax=Rhodotorula taiwanensis TaxID=741276 RepID=A0A2S5B7T2_9BASI|nr:hypothetical protein BMF94_4235 [Rhodotorula taiwanensis]